MATVLKTVDPEKGPWVRIPPSPPFLKAFMQDFNFDEWAELYRIDPTAFERKRSEVLEEAIQKAPVEVRYKLRVLQMQCDAVHNEMEPLKAAEEMTKLMMSKVYDLQDSYLNLAIACKDFDEQTRT